MPRFADVKRDLLWVQSEFSGVRGDTDLGSETLSGWQGDEAICSCMSAL